MTEGLVTRLRDGRAVWLWLGAYLAGLAAGASFSPPPFFFIIVAAAAVGLLWRWSRRDGGAFTIVILALFLMAGWARQEREVRRLERSRDLPALMEGPSPRLAIRLDEEPQRRPDYTVLYGEAVRAWSGDGWRPASGRVRLGVAGRLDEAEPGDLFLARTRLQAPHGYRNPGGFDYVAFLARRGIAVSGYVSSLDLIAKVEAPDRPVWEGAVGRARRAYLAWLGGVEGEGGALLRALLAGDREALSDETKERFAELGLSHLLSISGLHLGLVSFAVLFALWWLMRRSTRLAERVAAKRAAALLTIPLVIAYALLSGMRPPTQRALVMVLTFLLATALDKERDPWNALSLAALFILIAWPQALFEASFQLSFLSLAVILYGSPRMLAIWRGRPSEEEEAFARLADKPTRWRWLAGKIGSYLGGLLAVSVLVYWGLTPLMLEMFHAVNPLGPIYNLAAVPVTGLILLPLGMLASLAALPAPGPALILLRVPAFAGEMLVEFLDFLALKAPTQVVAPGFTAAGAAAWWLGGALILEGLTAARLGEWSWRWLSPAGTRERRLGPATRRGVSRRRALLAAGLGLMLLPAAMADLGRSREPLRGNALTVGAIEVGQGQAILVRTAGGRTLLVDGGGFYRSGFDVGEAVVAPCLLALGVRRLDAVALTHPHPDHARGLAYILAHFEVGEFWRGPDTNGLSDELSRIARSRGIPIRVWSESCAPIYWDDTEIRALHPPLTEQDTDDLNERSLVFRIADPTTTLLLCADVEREAETMLIDKYGPGGSVERGALRANLMTAPHHGSRTSSTEAFLEAVAPDFVLVSAAGPDRSGLPAPEVIERYRRRGIKALRTDLDGWTGVSFGAGRTEPFP